ncbi:unnamed protein product [Rotaria sp. Silwood1]|nr:unnamed protein product [Rotaria sp. Silwood1]CAF1556888.1 unnamed protein product [Rotaria sp. Silwood1]
MTIITYLVSFECENEVTAIESLCQRLQRRYACCPAFFMGSLQNACEEAFSSTVIKERRPVLVYIHNDENMFNNIFCCSIFCSSTIIDYLLENYIVWPCDVTFECNRNRLRSVWEEMFSTQVHDNFNEEQCPMLIGIMRLFEEKKNDSVKVEYQVKSLLVGDTLTRTQVKSNRETVLNELAIFKEECDENEQALVSICCRYFMPY